VDLCRLLLLLAATVLAPAKKTDAARHATAAARRDSAIGPKLEVDSTGKVRPIKKP
jgi:hypothetical protein